jgi:ABC-2 type transport system ATP-binding protein
MIEAAGLEKQYSTFKAVDSVSFQVPKGEIFGLLGPNGAGKSTTILMMLGLTEPSAGSIRIDGYDPARNPMKVKRITGYLPENVGFYEDLTAEENLLYFSSLNGLRGRQVRHSIEECLEMVDLKDSIRKMVGTFSKGMKQRLGIASILLKKPELVILDEPTNGIDPEGTEHLLDLILRMSRELGVTVLLSSHLLHQVQKICDRVAIMFRGQIVAIGSIDEIGQKLFGQSDGVMKLKVPESFSHEEMDQLSSLPGVVQVSKSKETLLLAYKKGYMGNIFKNLVRKDIYPFQVKGQEYSLEEIYLKYFQEG